MKKVLLFVLLAALGTTAAAQEFDKGHRRAGLTVGVGMIGRGAGSVTSFDQHVGMEWGVGNIGSKVTVGLGFAVNNTYASTGTGKITGTYDYYYKRYVNSAVIDYNKWDKLHRKGMGTADARRTREDIDIQATVSFHYSPVAKLDIYTTIGAGVGVMNFLVGNIHNEEGFMNADVDKTVGTGSHYVYSFNDLDHVEWENSKSKVVPAVSAFVGATYYFTKRWGADLQVGLLSADIKKGYTNSYGLFAVGVSHKF